ncbi:hypothetical protein CDAR_78051 [Caerostris darwini]|uniref:Uncharacterized protein n=1 Tax=Caerostris darwini TaxID=1538125 RepID=A0AAV4M3S1_9ARAC|nr:hypothetical protein CDAR_78051 [Caerostris darwini]
MERKGLSQRMLTGGSDKFKINSSTQIRDQRSCVMYGRKNPQNFSTLETRNNKSMASIRSIAIEMERKGLSQRMVTGGSDKLKINSGAQIRDQRSCVIYGRKNPQNFSTVCMGKEWKLPLPYSLME